MPASTTVAEALGISGTAKDQPITERQALALIEELKESAPLQGMSKVTEIKGASRNGVLTKRLIEAVVNDFAEFIPPSVAAKLPDFRIEVKASIRGAAGDYNNPHFPALRADPLALSGASRRKQTPSRHGRHLKSIWTTAASWFANTPEDPDRLAEKPPPK
jgi:hypothetical protein